MTQLLRAKQCAEIMGVSIPTWWNMVKKGKAPAGTSIGANTTVWRSDDLQALIDRICPRKLSGGEGKGTQLPAGVSP